MGGTIEIPMSVLILEFCLQIGKIRGVLATAHVGSVRCRCVSPRAGVTLAYRVDEGVPEVQSSGVRRAGGARAPSALATAATALEPQKRESLTHAPHTQHT